MEPSRLEVQSPPRDPKIAVAAAPKRNGAPKPSPGKVKILLVDDRDDKILALEAVLLPLGQTLVKARSGKEALRLLLKEEFAVILMDVSMPGMDGFETAELIRRRPSTELTPIIFITSIGNSPNQMYQGYSLGAVDYILAPIVPEVLRAKVSVFVDLSKKAEQIRQQNERLRSVEEAEHQRRLAEAVDRLETETKRNRFFTLALDMLGIADFDGRLIQTNPSWENVLGYSNGELKAISGLELAHPDERDVLAQKMEELKNGSNVAYYEGRFLHKDGSYRWLGWTAAPFPAERLFYIFARDITARKRSEDQISRLNEELEQRIVALTDANRELEAFNYSISHDLRAPLRSMGGFAQALLEQESASLSAHGLDYARRIIRSAKYMDDLLRDLLAYSQVARINMPLADVSIDDLLTQVVAVRDHEVRERGASIEIESPLRAVRGHPPTLHQIMANLLDNALKFSSPERPSRVRIRSTREADFVRTWIEDNGIGIPLEHHQKIFGLFERLHPPHAFPGTGIGLAIVRKGVERMGGRIGLESTPGEGSRFWVDLLPAANGDGT